MPEPVPTDRAPIVTSTRHPRRRARMLLGLVAFAVFMFGFAYLNIPLFRTFCEHYGIAIAPVNAASAPLVAGKRRVNVMFTAEVGSGLRLEFHPRHAIETVPLGHREENFYAFTNDTGKAVIFRAIHALYPYSAAENVAIMQCFCFTQQKLAPHQSRTLPVIYQVNPGLKANVRS